MHYKKQVHAWLTAMLLCVVMAGVAAALGSCGGGGKGTGSGGSGDAGEVPTTTIAQVVEKLVSCGFTGGDALTRRLAIDFSLANKEADGVVFPQWTRTYFQKVASAYLGCVVAAPCAQVVALYCDAAVTPAEGEGTLTACLTAVEKQYASQAPGAQFKCSDGTSLEDPAGALCDGTPECADGSDETPRACAMVEHIECDNKAAPDEWRCNSEAQCKDGTDEQNCFVCSESEVTGRANQCNGRLDCGSGADEEGCGETFGCPPTGDEDAATDGAAAEDGSVDAGP